MEHERCTAQAKGDESPRADAGPPIVGSSDAIREVCRLAARAAKYNVPVLITGETGVGKELVARMVHASGPRKDGPFVAVNVGAIAKELLMAELFGIGHRVASEVAARAGIFESADGGVVFLDEIGDAPPREQVALLRVLQERVIVRVGERRVRPVDVVVVAATHHDLSALIANGNFRADLYYRVAGLAIDVPPLRERREDIPELVAHLTARLTAQHGFPRCDLDEGALDALMAYAWPGNVRELEQVLRNAFVASEDGSAVTRMHLPAHVRGAERAGWAATCSDGGEPTQSSEGPSSTAPRPARCDMPGHPRCPGRAFLRYVWIRFAGNAVQTAKALGIDRDTFRRYATAHGIETTAEVLAKIGTGIRSLRTR